MFGIMGLSQRIADLNKFCGNQPKSTALKAGNHFTDQSALHTIGFYKYERSFHRKSSKIECNDSANQRVSEK
jgi:hypothetical protein